MMNQTQANQKFRFFSSIDSFEKGKDKQGNEVYKVGGLISDNTQDADGEMLDYNGFDFSEFSFINWNHGKKPDDLIGEPEEWKVVPGQGVYMQGYIYPDSQTGQSAIQLMKSLQKSKKGNKLGWSIEGQVVERDLINPAKVKKAKITAVALCPFPKNGNTFAELIQKGFMGQDVYQDNENLVYNVESNESDIILNEVDPESGDRIVVNIDGTVKIVKAISVQNSSCLAKEDVEGNEKFQLQKAIVCVTLAHKQGLLSDEKLTKLLKFKKFL